VDSHVEKLALSWIHHQSAELAELDQGPALVEETRFRGVATDLLLFKARPTRHPAIAMQ
jgi:hypothetical protein